MKLLDRIIRWRLTASENELLRQQVADLTKQLADEQFRNRCRENELTDRILTAAGRHPLTPDQQYQMPKPAPKPQPLSAMDEARRDALRKAAVAAGRPARDGDLAFEAQRNGHLFNVGLEGEPYILPT